MIIKAVNNQIVEIRLLGYQFPHSLDKEWDGNWLNLYFKIESQVGNWQTTDPSLTTWEIQLLIDWLNELADNKQPKFIELGFTEQNLSFKLQNDYTAINKIIRVKFDHGLRPYSAKEEKEYFVDFEADNFTLKMKAGELASELERFPIRN